MSSHRRAGRATLGLTAREGQRCHGGLRGSSAQLHEQDGRWKPQTGRTRIRYERLSCAVPYVKPWARWQRNPRAGGPAPRSDQQGSWVLHAALRGPAGSREGTNRDQDPRGTYPPAQAAQCHMSSHWHADRATLGLTARQGQRCHRGLRGSSAQLHHQDGR